MGVPGEQHVDARLLDRVERQLLPADRRARPRSPTGSANSGWWVTRIAHVSRGRAREGLADEVDLVVG